MVAAPPSDSRSLLAVLDAVPVSLALLDPEGRIRRTNAAWDRFGAERGADPAAIGVGTSYLGVCERAAARGDGIAREVLRGLTDVLDGRSPCYRSDYPCDHGTEELWFELQAWPLEPGEGLVVTHTDVTARVRTAAAYSRQARQDPLTGLANRAQLYDVLERELALRRADPVSVLFLDLDGFKAVNDSLGHDVGDLLLLELARRLSGLVRPGDSVARLGGDEFVVVAPRTGPDEGLQLAERLRRALSRPVEVTGMHLPVTVSIGVATAEQDTRAADLLRDADTALYGAKSSGRDRAHVFSSRLREQVEDRLALVSGLRRAVHQGELRLEYQPVLDLRTLRVEGVEALLRWDHPVRGLLPPASFIALAEETGLVVPITRWLLGEAARQGAAWAAAGSRLRTAVNVSAAHLTSRTLADDVEEALAVAGLDPGLLVLEITESVLARDTGCAVEQLNRLRSQGVEVAIDDFGAGYSSFGQLAVLPADVLKLDRSLLPPGDGSRRSAVNSSIVRAIVAVAEALDLTVLAEGVETRAELDLATELGCDLAQGFLLGRPVAPDEVVLPV